jgi:hypothetical protein
VTDAAAGRFGSADEAALPELTAPPALGAHNEPLLGERAENAKVRRR